MRRIIGTAIRERVNREAGVCRNDGEMSTSLLTILKALSGSIAAGHWLSRRPAPRGSGPGRTG